MQTRVTNFLDDLEKCQEKGEYRGYLLRDVDEGMAAILAANLFVDHGISSSEVLRALAKAGIGNDPKLLATFWDKNKREELTAVLASI